MPVFRIPDEHIFPHPSLAEPDGLLGVGGDLNVGRLMLAYANGIFPWYNQGQPILWFSPDPRFVLSSEDLKVPRSLRKRIRRRDYEIRLDSAFDEVIRGCKKAYRPGQRGTWITPDMEAAYSELYRLGYAHSAEAWLDGELVGGLYGVSLGGMFSGESMFARQNDASKIAFVWLVQQLSAWGLTLIDCQVRTEHLARFGATEMPRQRYLNRLRELIPQEGKPGRWSFDPGFFPI